jgi:hypothetical protein
MDPKSVCSSALYKATGQSRKFKKEVARKKRPYPKSTPPFQCCQPSHLADNGATSNLAQNPS